MNPLKQLHVKPNDDLRELASLYALDALAQEEMAAYEAHLGAGKANPLVQCPEVYYASHAGTKRSN